MYLQFGFRGQAEVGRVRVYSGSESTAQSTGLGGKDSPSIQPLPFLQVQEAFFDDPGFHPFRGNRIGFVILDHLYDPLPRINGWGIQKGQHRLAETGGFIGRPFQLTIKPFPPRIQLAIVCQDEPPGGKQHLRGGLVDQVFGLAVIGKLEEGKVLVDLAVVAFHPANTSRLGIRGDVPDQCLDLLIPAGDDLRLRKSLAHQLASLIA